PESGRTSVPHVRNLLVIPLLAALIATAIPADAQQWELVWSDEFDTPGAPDPSKWTYDIGGHGWGNQELQYYTDRLENARVEDGVLIIEARGESFGGNDYTSARLVTRGLAAWQSRRIEARMKLPVGPVRGAREESFAGIDDASARLVSRGLAAWQQGRIEARMKMPIGRGIWPAGLMLPSDSAYGGWPAGGEIDIMEYLGHVPNQVHGTIHSGGGELGHRFTGDDYVLQSGTFADDFHVFALEWEPRQMRWYVDGELYLTQVSWSSIGGPYPAPFDHPFHILMNVAVGGQWPGYPDETTTFPQQMLVDYVRVYQDTTAAPTVALEAPEDGLVIGAGDTLEIRASASSTGEITEVAFLRDGGVLGVATSAPYEMSIGGLVDGCYVLRARATNAAGYVTTGDSVQVTVGGGCPPGNTAPYLMVPARIPGTIEAEYYDLGGSGVAYFDLSATNDGNGIRPNEGVDIRRSRDEGGGHDVTYPVARE